MISNEKYKALSNDILNNVKYLIIEASNDDIDAAIMAIDKLLLDTRGHANMSFSKARKSLTPLRNTLLGMLDEQEADDISISASVKQHQKKLKQQCRSFIDESRKVLEASKYKNFKDAESELRKRLQEHEDGKTISDKESAKIDKDVDTLLKYRNVYKKLPTSIPVEDFVLVKAPLIPLFNKVMMKFENNLNKVQIDYDQLDFYFILKEQYMLAVNSQNDIKFIWDALDVINNSGSTKYVLVSDKLVKHPKADVAFAWIMEKTKFNKLSTDTGTFSVSRWSFPVNFRK